MEDLKNVISDQNTLIQEKNAGDLLQNIIRHFWALLQELRHDESLRNSFEEWQGNFTSLLSSTDILQFVYQAGDLFTSLQDSEEFLDLLMQLIDALKSIIADKTEQVNSGASAKEMLDPEQLKRETEQDRQKILEQIKSILATLSENRAWLSFRQRSRLLKAKAREAGDLAADQAKDIAHQVQDSENFQALYNDFKELLQRLIGDEKSVDPFFEHCRQAADEILNNDELAYVLEEASLLLKKVAEDPALLDEPAVQERASNLADRADKVLEEAIKPKIYLAKEESKQLLCCIKSDPSSAKFLEDIKALWKDLASDKTGELLDLEVLGSIKQMLIPLILEHLQNVPIPKIDGTASKYFIAIFYDWPFKSKIRFGARPVFAYEIVRAYPKLEVAQSSRDVSRGRREIACDRGFVGRTALKINSKKYAASLKILNLCAWAVCGWPQPWNGLQGICLV